MAIDVARLIKEAGEAAKLVPEHLQEAAFNQAYQTLLAAAEEEQSSAPKKRSSARAAKKVENMKGNASSLDELDRTAHPEINHNSTALDNALRLLRAAKDDLGIDGLSASAIANVLNDKFRCSVSRRQVSQVLNDAGSYVNRHKDGNAVIFRIMGPGEEHLDSPRTESDPAAASPKVRPKRKVPSSEPSSKSRPKKKAGRKPSSGGRVGPAAAMTHLLEAGYFSAPRTIGEIIEKLKHDRGRTFKSNELSPTLVRWLRAERLTRSQNSDGQYEYSAP